MKVNYLSKLTEQQFNRFLGNRVNYTDYSFEEFAENSSAVYFSFSTYTPVHQTA